MRGRRFSIFFAAAIFAAMIIAALVVSQSVSFAAGQKRTGGKATQVKAGQKREEKKAMSESPIMCVIDGLDAKQRERHKELAGQLRDRIQEVRELSDGYALRLPPDKEMILSVAEFITLERLCCPFFNFELEVEREQGALWLKMTGRDGVKEFLKSQLEFR